MSDKQAPPAAQAAPSLLRPLVEDLEARRAHIKLGGGQEKIDRQHEKGALTARERIALLVDADPGSGKSTFVELGIHGRPHSSQRAMDGVDAPADGVITGYGKVDGRLTAVCAYDFTVMAGSMGMTGEFKVTRLRELALTKRIPFVWLLDSAGARVHCRKSGVGDMEVASDEECIERIKQYLSYMPQNCEAPVPVRVGGPDGAEPDPIDRADEELLEVLPESNRKPYDMYEVIRRITDDGEHFDIKGQWAKTIITCFARFGGRPAGIVANQPKQLGGILDNDSADKAARFVNLCNAFGIPLVFIQDVPGFMVGTKVEAAGIIRHGAKMLYAVANATVPKLTVITRKAYGAGYYVMCGRAYEPDLIVAWPSAEISVMGAEGVVEIAFRKAVDAAEDPGAKRAELIENFKKLFDVYIAAGNDLIDDVIDPRETRAVICRGLEMAAGKRVERPWKRQGVVPV